MAIRGVKVNGTTHSFDYEYLENKPDALPSVSANDAGKVLKVSSNGTWSVADASGGVDLDDYIELLSSDERFYSSSQTGIMFDIKTAFKNVRMTNPTVVPVRAFTDCDALSSIDFPNVLTVCDHAFYNCSSLTSISLPAAQEIDGYAFFSCYSLASVNLPSAQTIDGFAFANCSSLASVFVNESCSFGPGPFYNCINPSTHTLSVYFCGSGASIPSLSFTVEGIETYYHPFTFDPSYLGGGEEGESPSESESESESESAVGGFDYDSLNGYMPGLSIFVPESRVTDYINDVFPSYLANNIFPLPSEYASLYSS